VVSPNVQEGGVYAQLISRQMGSSLAFSPPDQPAVRMG